MKSYAQVQGHPLHPALIPFPFALLTSAFAFDAAGWWMDRLEWTYTGIHLIQLGLLAGIVAAIPGLLDYRRRVPPDSSARTRALQHGLLNSAALVLFAVAWWLRTRIGVTVGTLVLEFLGAADLVYSGSMGGVLVTRNLISVDHRHANAGKWSESTFSATRGEGVVVAKADELTTGQMKLVIVNGHRIAVANTGHGFKAIDDRCSHRGGSLADGVCIGNAVQCLWHGSRFDLTTGDVECGPAKKAVRTYELTRKDSDIVLTVP